MPQKHDIGQQKRNRPPQDKHEPPDGAVLARRLVDKGLAEKIILDHHMKHQKEN